MTESYSHATNTQYKVLARKYRPSTFSELIGQESMVRVLTNAVKMGRLAHAFMLTGVRGVGKTTTARIIAKGLNCSGPDNLLESGPTVEPCGQCEHCLAITEDRHIDVLEMDAASRTGVDDIRELIDGVRYRPTSARYKVYIIDEVHMLSKNAFNALLKTLEEPPEHVKFIFATTEIRKVPITILSRCQRFDLRRVKIEELCNHFKSIAKKEDAQISESAVKLIARTSDGSVRDGLSLLDQVISQANHEICEEEVRDMLGIADRTQSFDIFEYTLSGDAGKALDIMSWQYKAGADPVRIVEDLLEISHWITRIKVLPETANDLAASEIERTRGLDLASRLGMATISRAWQILLKGLSEMQSAPSLVQAAEMVIIRLAYASNLPTPENAIKSLTEKNSIVSEVSTLVSSTGGDDQVADNIIQIETSFSDGSSSNLSAVASNKEEINAQEKVPTSLISIPKQDTQKKCVFKDLAEIAHRAGESREGKLQAFLQYNARLVKFEPGSIILAHEEHTDDLMLQRLSKFLLEETGDIWNVNVSGDKGGQTLQEKTTVYMENAIADARTHPLVAAVMETFPGSTITDIEKCEADMISDNKLSKVK